MRVVLLLLGLCLLWTAGLKAQSATQSFIVKVALQDPEGAYNANYHKLKLQLVEQDGIQNFLFVEEENVFIVQGTQALSGTSLQQAMGTEAEVRPLSPADYQRLYNKQYSLKLAVNQGKGAPESPGFPKYLHSGNEIQDRDTYRQAVLRYLDKTATVTNSAKDKNMNPRAND